MKFIVDRIGPARQGFTFVEIAIVLVIAGILFAVGAKLIGPLTKHAKRAESRKITEAAEESLITHGAINNELPAMGDFSAAVRNPNDAWQKSIYYVVDSDLTDSATGGICGRRSTNITLKICPDSGCSSPDETIRDLAFIILSGGDNYNNQTAGTQSASSDTTINTYEVDVSVDDYAADMDRAEAYDDIVRWVTINELRTRTECVGAQLSLVTRELPYAYADSAYSATVFGDGGLPFSSGGDYRWCREESASTALTFTPSVSSADCLGLTESSWTQADSIVISGTPTTAGTYKLVFFVRDDNDPSGTDDNIAQKTIVLTINPASIF